MIPGMEAALCRLTDGVLRLVEHENHEEGAEKEDMMRDVLVGLEHTSWDERQRHEVEIRNLRKLIEASILHGMGVTGCDIEPEHGDTALPECVEASDHWD